MIFASGVVPGLLQWPAATDPHMQMEQMYGRALGLFPVEEALTLQETGKSA
jgi:hypothetical protein